eukprot:g2563.t1
MTSIVSSLAEPCAATSPSTATALRPQSALLPEDLFAIVFSYLSLNDIMTASLVSNHLNKCIQACTEIQIPTHLSLQSGRITTHIADKFPFVKSLTFDNCKGLTNETLADMVARLPDLRCLDMKQLNGRDLPAILVAQGWASRLEGLRLSGVLFLRPQTLDTLVQSFSKSLVDVKLGGVRTMEDKHVAALAMQCPELCRANFDGCSKLQDVELNMVRVEELCFSHCVSLNSLTVGPLCGNQLGKLRTLDLSYCRKLDEGRLNSFLSGTETPNLETIDLSFCYRLKTIQFTVMPKARTILLEGCANLKSVVTLGALPSLEHFHVGMCVELKSVELNVPKVSRLDLCMLAITNLTIVSKELTFLDLSGCRDLESNNMTLLQTEQEGRTFGRTTCP